MNKKSQIALSCSIFIVILGVSYYLITENSKNKYLKTGLAKINACIESEYNGPHSCTNIKIDNRDVVNCSVGNTKLIFEITKTEGNYSRVFAINGKARQLSSPYTIARCQILESEDYEFSNKVI